MIRIFKHINDNSNNGNNNNNQNGFVTGLKTRNKILIMTFNFFLPLKFPFTPCQFLIINFALSLCLYPTPIPCSGVLQMQKRRTHLLGTQSSKVFPLKSGVGQKITLRASLTARDFFLSKFYLFGPFTVTFSKPLLSQHSFFLLIITDN